uniref:LPXTG cell wall anchor domain-containing protein n=1 Tax=Staphylococcus hominis TaxID=1290 RepID=UPI0022E3167E
IPEGNVTAKATDDAEHPNSSTSDPVRATDITSPTTPTVNTDLTGKAHTLTPIEVTTDPHTHVDLLDKDGNIIGSGTTDDSGHVTITPNKPIPEGNVTAKATDDAEHPNSSTSIPVKATDTTPPAKPTVNTDLTGKAHTLTPIEVTTDPHTHVDLLDKDGNIIGSGTTDDSGHVTITPNKPIPEGNVTAKATDDAEHPNSSTSIPVKATDTTPPAKQIDKDIDYNNTSLFKNDKNNYSDTIVINKNTNSYSKIKHSSDTPMATHKIHSLPETGKISYNNISLPASMIVLLGGLSLLFRRKKEDENDK